MHDQLKLQYDTMLWGCVVIGKQVGNQEDS